MPKANSSTGQLMWISSARGRFAGAKCNSARVPPPRKHHATDAAHHSEREALYQELPDNPAPRRAKRCPHGDFPRAHGGAGERSRRRSQQIQSLPHRPHKLIRNCETTESFFPPES
jgi:hypothetical protein